MSPATYARKKGIVWWNQGSLRRHKCNVRRISFRIYRAYRLCMLHLGPLDHFAGDR